MRTQLLALTYSAWSEAQFTQILYTPNAFSSSELDEILKVKRAGITALWERLIRVSINKVSSTDKEEKKNKINELKQYIDLYIFKQSQIRNKIAHGQWIHPVEDKKEKANELKERLDKLNVVDIMREFEIHTTLGKIVRDLVQSPNNGFYQNYDVHINKLNNYIDKSKSWDICTKSDRLLLNPKKMICDNCGHIH